MNEGCLVKVIDNAACRGFALIVGRTYTKNRRTVFQDGKSYTIHLSLFTERLMAKSFFNKLKQRKGDVICITNKIWWFGGGGYDNEMSRFALLIDVVEYDKYENASLASEAETWSTGYESNVIAYLLINNKLKHVRITQADVVFI